MHLASSDGFVPMLISEEVQRKDSNAYCCKYEVERPAEYVLRCGQETHGVDMLLRVILNAVEYRRLGEVSSGEAITCNDGPAETDSLAISRLHKQDLII